MLTIYVIDFVCDSFVQFLARKNAAKMAPKFLILVCHIRLARI